MKSVTQAQVSAGNPARTSVADVCLASCRKLLAQIERTKAQVVAEFRGKLQEHGHLLELAINEAAALAWQTGYPQLLFPELAEERARAVATWHARQAEMLQNHPTTAIAA